MLKSIKHTPPVLSSLPRPGLCNHATNVQLLCEDERGLVSVYFEHEPFGRFFRALHKAGLKLVGPPIKFNRVMVRVPALSKLNDYSLR